MKHVEVESVESARSSQGIELWHVVVITTDDSGSTGRILHVMPKWTVEARMAEYGCDQPTAIRLALTEPFVETSGPAAIHTEPLWQVAAREHIERVEQLHDELGFDALGARVDGNEEPHPIETLAAADVRPDVVAALRFEVAEVRQMLRDEPAPVEPQMPVQPLRPVQV